MPPPPCRRRTPLASGRSNRLDAPLMASQLVAAPSAAESSSSAVDLSPTLTERVVRMLVRRRVHMTLVLFTAVVLIVLFVVRSRPCGPFSLTDPWAIAGILFVLAGLAIRS